MPNRILKESVCTSITLDQLDADQERLFYRLMVQCDDFGRFYAHPGIVRGHCFPRKFDLTLEQLGGWLDALEQAGLIRRYAVDGEAYLQMVTWDKHQQVRAKRSKFPGPDSKGAQPLADDPKPEQEHASASNGNQLLAGASNGNHLQANVPVIQSNPIQSNPDPNRNPNPFLRASPAETTDPQRKTKGESVPKPNRLGEVIDLIRAADVPITPTDRDGKAVKTCSASATLLAEAYIAAFRGDWDPGGNGWLRGNLALHQVVPRLAGYEASKNAPRMRNGRPAQPEPHYIDRTGQPN